MRRLTALLVPLLLVLSALASPAEAATVGSLPCSGSYDTFTYGTPTQTELGVHLQCGSHRVDFYGTGLVDPQIDTCPGAVPASGHFTGFQYYGSAPVSGSATWDVSVQDTLSVLTGRDASGHTWRGTAHLSQTGAGWCQAGIDSTSSDVTAVESGASAPLPSPAVCHLQGTADPVYGVPGRSLHGPVRGYGSCRVGTATWAAWYDGDWLLPGGTVAGACVGQFWVDLHLTDPSTGRTFVQTQSWNETVALGKRAVDVHTDEPVQGDVQVGEGTVTITNVGTCDLDRTRDETVTLAFALLP